MWIVRLALRRPYTFVVAALLLLLMTPFVLTKTPTDIFPAINIPVISVIWQFTGLPADHYPHDLSRQTYKRVHHDLRSAPTRATKTNQLPESQLNQQSSNHEKRTCELITSYLPFLLHPLPFPFHILINSSRTTST